MSKEIEGIVETKLDFPHQDDNNWLEIEVGGIKRPQYPSPFEVKMLLQSQADQYQKEKGEMVDLAWEYVVKAMREESGSKEDLKEFIEKAHGVDLSE